MTPRNLAKENRNIFLNDIISINGIETQAKFGEEPDESGGRILPFVMVKKEDLRGVDLKNSKITFDNKNYKIVSMQEDLVGKVRIRLKND